MDSERVENVLAEAGDDLPATFWWLIVLLGGMVQTVADTAGRTFDKSAEALWPQLAARSDTAEAQAMRAMVIAWQSGDEELVTLVQAQMAEVDVTLLAIEFAGAIELIARSLGSKHGSSLDEILSGLLQALKAEDERGGQ